MKHYSLILSVLLLTSTVHAQLSFIDNAILSEVLKNSATCNKFYYTNKTDSFFINQFVEQFKNKDIWLHGDGKSRKIILSKPDKATIIQELTLSKKALWTDEKMFVNSRIVPLDKIFDIDNYIDTVCLARLKQSDTSIRVFSFGKPILINNGNSLVVYVVEIGIHPKAKRFYYVSYKLMLFRKTDNEWKKIGDLYNGYACNG